MRISIVPFYDHYLQNRLFKFANTWSDHWQEGNVRLFEECGRRGYRIGTCDCLPPEESDVVVFWDYPRTVETVREARRKAPFARTVLVLYETPLENPHWFDRRNHVLFDAVLTYNPALVDDEKYFPLHLPVGVPPQTQSDLSFSDRKLLVSVSTNRYFGIGAMAKPWHYCNRLRELRRSGWQATLKGLIDSRRGDLYETRRRLIRAAEGLCPDDVDVFGKGWEGRSAGWYYRFRKERPYKLARGPANEDKLQLLGRYRFVVAYENFEGDVGYVSEKMFDALYSGTVPVYRGERNIAKYVSPECFIDARRFANHESLIRFVMSCPEREWERLRAAARGYLASEQISLFQPKHYVTAFLNCLEAVTERNRTTAVARP